MSSLTASSGTSVPCHLHPLIQSPDDASEALDASVAAVSSSDLQSTDEVPVKLRTWLLFLRLRMLQTFLPS